MQWLAARSRSVEFSGWQESSLQSMPSAVCDAEALNSTPRKESSLESNLDSNSTHFEAIFSSFDIEPGLIDCALDDKGTEWVGSDPSAVKGE